MITALEIVEAYTMVDDVVPFLFFRWGSDNVAADKMVTVISCIKFQFFVVKPRGLPSFEAHQHGDEVVVMQPQDR
jgi:hypothetical protein